MRIRKMQQKGIIEEFVARVEPSVLGYDTLYFVVASQDTEEILRQVCLVGVPYLVVPCIGGITVYGITVRDGIRQKAELARRLMKDIRVLSIFEAEGQGFRSNLTRTDLDILEELIRNPRDKIEDLARNTDLSTKTIARCIEKLQKNKVVQFTVMYDPRKIRNFIPHVILAWADGNADDTLRIINERHSESYLQSPFVARNLIVLFMYNKDIFDMDQVTQEIRNIPNLMSADLFIPKKISFHDEWLETAISGLGGPSTLHIAPKRG